jgi:hypothetical protein
VARGVISLQDPFRLPETPASFGPVVSGALWNGNQAYTSASDRTVRGLTVNTSIKNLVVLVAGQSLRSSQLPTDFALTNSTVIDNFSVYDGAMYAYKHPVIGSTYVGNANGGGPGFLWGKVADLFITNGIFDRVIIVPLAIGGSDIQPWASGYLATKIPVALARLAARGIVPRTNVTFAIEWGQGESDNQGATTTANYLSMLNTVIANAFSAGFSGRFFVAKESWIQGVAATRITDAQTSAVNGTTVFASGNLDSLDGTYRDVQNTHFNDAGGTAAATLIYNAMHASGAPY